MTPHPFAMGEDSSTSSRTSATLRATRKGITWVGPRAHDARVVDVEVDGARLWSSRMPAPTRGGRRRLEWPKALHPHLGGRGSVTVRDHATDAVVAQGAYQFATSAGRLAIADVVSEGLVVDKWGKLVPAASASLHRELLEGLDRVVDDLGDAGFAVSVTGGTLLGAVRAGAILERDDDADVTVYLGERHPADVTIASYEIERVLAAHGHRVIRHSDAHLQLIVGAADAHVDVFLGFHHRGEYHQPIAVRGPFEVDRILPLGVVTLHGREYPAVADPEGWLELCYGPGWRSPDPSFRFQTPASTRRRFENWFGVYDLNRHFWEAAVVTDGREHWAQDVELLLGERREARVALDLGCGRGGNSGLLAAAGYDVVAVDYALRAVRAVERLSVPGIRARRLNFADRHAVLEFVAELVRRGDRVDVLLSDVLAYLTRDMRRNVYLMLRGLLADGGVAVASFPVNPSVRYDHHRPDTWHLPIAWLREEAAAFGLELAVRGHDYRRTSAGRRLVATAVLRRRHELATVEEVR